MFWLIHFLLLYSSIITAFSLYHKSIFNLSQLGWAMVGDHFILQESQKLYKSQDHYQASETEK